LHKIKYYISILLVLSFLLTNFTSQSAQAASFSDFKEGQTFYSEVSYLVGENIISGYKDGTFRPVIKITRAAAATMIGRALNLDGTQRKGSFKDVPKESYASGYIDSAVSKGIIRGFTDGTFRPNEEVTRGQMAIFIDRAFALKDKKSVLFSDVSSSIAAYSSIQKIVAAGITQGYSDWTFRPNTELSRAEFSAFLARALNPDFKVTIPNVDPLEINYSISNGKVESNHHNGKLIVLKPGGKIELNKLNNGSDRVLINSVILDFEDENTIVPIKNGVGEITIIPNGYDWEEAYNYVVLVGAQEDITKSVLNKHFIELASEGYLNGCDFSVDYVRSENIIDHYATSPNWEGTLSGGYGRQYSSCTYYGVNDSYSSPIGTIDMDGSKIDKTPAQIKQAIGHPSSEGYSELNGSWTLYYDLDEYSLFFSFAGPNSKLDKLRYKEINNFY